MKKRLAIITTHPIQYNAPLFKLMSAEGDFAIKVFYTWSQSKEKVFDKEFGRAVEWDIPLLDGYEYTFVNNTSTDPGSHQFKGVINPTLNKEIEDWQADGVLVFGWAFSSHLKAIRHFYKKIPVLFRGDSTLIDEPSGASLKKTIRRLFLRWVYSHVDYALYVGSENKRYFEAHGLKKRQLLFAPHAIDNSRFISDETTYCEKAKSWRAGLKIPENDVVFLFAAKLTKKKDPELLIKSFLALNQRNTWLIMIGNGELEAELKAKYQYGNIIFIGFQNQRMMPVVYRLGDVFVLPSKGPGETWGLAINEAMACAKSVIASDKCGCSNDLIFAGKNGYVFRSGDQQSLQDSLGRALHHFAEQGVYSKKIIGDWTYSRTVDQLNMLFKKLPDEES